MFPADVPVRHGWAWLRDDWEPPKTCFPDPADLRLVERWRSDGFPFVVATSPEKSIVRLGLATADRRRIGFSVERRCVAKMTPPLALSDAIVVAPMAWRDSLFDIAESAKGVGMNVYVYGSLAWTCRSRINYLRPDSDVDLLLVPFQSSLIQVRWFVQTLARRAGEPRLDGELSGPMGAVSWREFAQCPDALLVKTKDGPVIVPRVEFEAAMTTSLE